MKNSKIRYVVVGGSVYVVEVAVILLAQGWGAGPVLAVAIGFLVGLTLSFILQKFFTFGDRRTHHRIVIAQVVAVMLLVLFNFSFTLLSVKLASPPFPAVVVRTLALGITTLWNFYLYQTHIFSNPEDTLH